jgi:hypothetical protein
MLDDTQLKRLNEILAELDDLFAKDHQFISPRALGTGPIVSIPIQELFESGKRHERRRFLQDELQQMASRK